MAYEVSGVPHEDVYRILPLIDKHLNNVIPYTGGRYEKQDGVVVTQFTVYPRKKVFTILLCCGDHLNKWYSPLFEMLYSFANVNKCDLAEVVGRKGWVRKLKDDGFKQSVWIVEREF